MTLIHFGTTYIVVKAKYEEVKGTIEIGANSFQTVDDSNNNIVVKVSKINYIKQQ